MRLYKHFSMPNSLFIAMSNLQTPCINYEQPGVVNIKHVLCVSSGSPQSMPCMTIVLMVVPWLYLVRATPSCNRFNSLNSHHSGC